MVEAGQRWRAKTQDHHEIVIVEPVSDREDAWVVHSESGRATTVLASEIRTNCTQLDL